jgi:hypothetical protein
MQPDSESDAVAHIAPKLSRDAQMRLIIQRVASGYYQRHDVLHEAAEKIFRSS